MSKSNEIKDSVNLTTEIKDNSVKAVRGLARWFEFDFSIKLFGQEIIHWHYPPEENN